MSNRLDIVTVLDKKNMNYEYLLNELFNKIKESRILCIIFQILRDSSYLFAINRYKIPLISKFFSWQLTKIQINHIAFFLAHHQILKYSRIMHQIIHSFENYTS